MPTPKPPIVKFAREVLRDGPHALQDGQFVCELARGVIDQRGEAFRDVRKMIESRFSCGAARENSGVALMLCSIMAELDVMIEWETKHA